MPLVAVNCHSHLELCWGLNQFDSEWKVYNPGYELGERIYVPVRSSVLNGPHGEGYSAPEFTNIKASTYWIEFEPITTWLMTTCEASQ